MDIFVFVCLLFYLVGRISKGFRKFLDSAIILGYPFCLFCKDIFFSDFLLNSLIIFSLSVYMLRDILYGIKVLTFKITLINKFKTRFKSKFREHIEGISEVTLVISIITIVFYIQKGRKLPFPDIDSRNLMELLGFVITILSMYGVYIAFLQYLTSNLKSDTYLGQSKANYLIKKSFWYYMTQSKIFITMLLFTVLIPIIVKMDIIYIKKVYIKDLNLLWQSLCFLLLIIYIFLIHMSLKIIRVALLMKANLDENLKENMRKEIQKEYTDIFWFIYNRKPKCINKFIWNKLSMDFKKLDKREYREFVTNLFKIKYFDERNLYYTVLHRVESGFKLTCIKKIQNWFIVKFEPSDVKERKRYQDKNSQDSTEEWYNFYDYFKSFVLGKWNFLKDYQKDIPFDTWKDLIEKDLEILDKIIESDTTFEILHNQDKNVREFLFELLIDKDDIDINSITKSIKKEIGERKGDLESNPFLKYSYDFLEFRLEKVFEKYKKGDITFALLKFKSLFDDNQFKNNRRNDCDNSMLYSEICFKYLGGGRIEDFSKNEKISGLILSMNEEYRLAFMLFQIFYTDNIQFDNNIQFYDAEVSNIMNYDSEYQDYLFEQAENIILKTNINHRITKEFLEILWKTSSDVIYDFTWFEQFGNRHRMNNFKILYIQGILQGGKTQKSRFDFEKKLMTCGDDTDFKERRKKLGCFCRDYLFYTDKIPSIFSKELNEDKLNSLQLSVEYSLHNSHISLLDIIENISVTSLVRLEWMLKYKFHYKVETDYNEWTFFHFLNAGYFLIVGEGLVQFYIIKIVDEFYQGLYEKSEFIEKLKYLIIYNLIAHNKTIEGYVESIIERVSGVVEISDWEKKQIIFKLNEILLK